MPLNKVVVDVPLKLLSSTIPDAAGLLVKVAETKVIDIGAG